MLHVHVGLYTSGFVDDAISSRNGHRRRKARAHTQSRSVVGTTGGKV